MTGFQNWARSPSVVERDDTLDFEAQPLKDALHEWTKHGSVPRRSAFTLRSAKAFLGNVILFEQIAPAHFLIRLMGTGVTSVLGEMQGRSIEEAVPQDVAGRWTAVLEDVVAECSPRRIVNRISFANRDYLEAEIFLAPLLDDQGQPSMILAVIAFQAGVAIGKENSGGARHKPGKRQ